MADARGLVGLAAAILVLHLALIQPNHPLAATWGALRLIPLELPVVAILLLLAPGRPMRTAIAAALTLMVAVKAADLAANIAFARPFNLVLDLHLAPAGWRMLSGAVGLPTALGAAALLAALVALVAAALWWATGRVAAQAPQGRGARRGLAAALAALGVVALADVAREISPVDPPGSAFTARIAWEHGFDTVRALRALAAFRVEASGDPWAAVAPETLFPGLRGRDVMVVFIESYGRTALENPLFAPTITATLREAGAALGSAGLGMRSAWLTAPMSGGQSWLAHATLLSGLTVADQSRYRALIASPRRTLLHFARASGWRTVAVMPAIILAWPEAGYFGYDRVLAAAELGYAGKPFNWITMPDQFTLAAFERAELAGTDRPAVFAEIALISSHAPWTPVPPILPWEAIGDGRVYDAAATSGEPPEVLWRDADRVRQAYLQTLDYSLRSVFSFAERRAETGPLIVALGDHQPAGFVAQERGGFDVPVHVIGPEVTLAALDGWGWTEGPIPAVDAPVWPMARFRDSFLAAFSAAAAKCVARAGTLPAGAGC